MKKQVHAYYSGRVQGVGFRFTARSIAEELGVLGWAKNLRDGKVEIVAEAPEEALQEFLDKITQCFSRYIQDSEINWQAASGNFKDFQIAF
jgi:acylphosphatase